MENSINLNILLIEDNPGDAFLIKFYLEESVLKYARLLHAEYLNTAIDLLQHNEFDVVLLDLNLPDSAGIATLQAILDAAKGSVVIVLTGLNDEELGAETVKLGAQDFLVKGQFDGKVLTSSVRYAFERYQLQKQVMQYRSKLKESVNQFNLAQQVGDFGYWELNLEDGSMHWSKNLISLMGVDSTKEPQTLGDLLKLMPADIANTAEKKFNEVSTNQSKLEFSFEANGQHFSCTAMPSEQNGQVSQIAGIIKKVG